MVTKLDPGKHTIHVSLERAKLVYDIVIGMNIDIGHLIWAKIVKASTTTAIGLWFSSLITTLCRQVGVAIGSGVYHMRPLLPIKRVSETQYTYR